MLSNKETLAISVPPFMGEKFTKLGSRPGALLADGKAGEVLAVIPNPLERENFLAKGLHPFEINDEDPEWVPTRRLNGDSRFGMSPWPLRKIVLTFPKILTMRMHARRLACPGAGETLAPPARSLLSYFAVETLPLTIYNYIV